MVSKNARLAALLDKVPGKRIFGVYRFLPLFFVAGAALEFTMINWHVGQVNFYKTYKRKRSEELAKEATYQSRIKAIQTSNLGQMPAGVSWPIYLRFAASAILSMAAGSQVVHMYYHPLANMDELVEKEKQKLLAKSQEK